MTAFKEVAAQGLWTVVDKDSPRYRQGDVQCPTLTAAVSILPAFQVADILDPDGHKVATYHLMAGLHYLDPRPAVPSK